MKKALCMLSMVMILLLSACSHDLPKSTVKKIKKEVATQNLACPVKIEEGLTLIKVKFDPKSKTVGYYIQDTEDLLSTISNKEKKMLEKEIKEEVIDDFEERVEQGVVYKFYFVDNDGDRVFEFKLNKEDLD